MNVLLFWNSLQVSENFIPQISRGERFALLCVFSLLVVEALVSALPDTVTLKNLTMFSELLR